MKKIISVLAILTLVGCAATPGQNTYMAAEAGKVRKTEFGTAVDVRPITIKGKNSGGGALVGGLAGAGVGTQVGSGDGTAAAILVGALIGAVSGAVAEQALADQKGFDITVTLHGGETVTVSQYFKKDEPVIKVGQRVMVQTTGDYMRVLPATHLPESIKRPKKIKVVD